MTVIIDGTSGIDNNATDLSYTGTLTGGAGVVNLGSGQVYKDASGNVGIGTSSPSYKLTVLASNLIADFRSSAASSLIDFTPNGYAAWRIGAGIVNVNDFGVYDVTNSATRMIINSSGNLLVGTTSADQANTRLQVNGGIAGTQMFVFKNTITSGSAYALQTTLSYAPNDSTSRFMTCGDSAGDRILLRSNGGIANYSANNVNLSDERLKTAITPASSYLDKICAIPVVTYLYKDQTDTETNLGVIAQAVEAVAPELIDNSGFGESPEGEAPYKAIYQTDLQYALMKCIQEQQTLITALTARITALEAPIV